MKENGLPLNEKECVTPYEALKSLTIDFAGNAILMILLVLEVGKKADFVILDKDPLVIPKAGLINLKVVQAWMNGRPLIKDQS